MKKGTHISGLLMLLVIAMVGCDAGNATLIPQTAADDATMTIAPDATDPESVNEPAITVTPSPDIEILVTPLITANLSRSTPACVGATNTRIVVGERGRVTDNDQRPLNIRSGPGTEFRILGRLEVLEIFDVLEGPECGTDYLWYRIRRSDSLVGWVAEGVPGLDFIEPYLPG